MALREQRQVFESVGNLKVNEVTTSGKILCYGTTSGSGAALADAAGGSATAYANPSGYKPVGMLMVNVVSLDTTLYPRNQHKQDQLTGERAEIGRKVRGEINTILGTPTPGAPAYLGVSGYATVTLHATGGLAATPKIGEFYSGLDQYGYAGIEINLP